VHCTDPNFCEFNASANCDNSSCLTLNVDPGTCNTDCTFGSTEVWNPVTCQCDTAYFFVVGCTDLSYCEFNPNATCDDGSCNLVIAGPGNCNSDCLNGSLEVWNPATCNCDFVSLSITGCTDPNYCEYVPIANCDDGTCYNLIFDPGTCNTNCLNGDLEVWDPISCNCEAAGISIPGCTDSNYCEFNPNANCDDGTCISINTNPGTCNTDCLLGSLEVWDYFTCTCELTVISIIGCTDPNYCEYNPNANCDDGTCLTLNANPGTCNTDCTLGNVEAWDSIACQCLTIQFSGCTDPNYCEYDPNVNCDDGTCVTPNTDPGICNNSDCTQTVESWNPITCQCELVSVVFSGCTDPNYCEYNPNANCNDGSCLTLNTDPGTCNTDCTLGDIEVWSSLLCQCIAVQIGGCTDPNFCEYDPNITCDNGSCITPNTDPGTCNTTDCSQAIETWNPITCQCDLVAALFLGCTDPNYCEYNPSANCDDGSCQTLNNNCQNVVGCLPNILNGCSTSAGINNVTLVGENQSQINNTSFCASNYFSNYTNLPALAVYPGNVYTIAITPNGINSPMYSVVFVNWNNDTDYLDPNEFYDLGAHMGIVSSSITVPNNIAPGNYTFAVMSVFDLSVFGTPITQTNYCTNTFFTGEFEEYSLEVIANTMCPPVLNFTNSNPSTNPVEHADDIITSSESLTADRIYKAGYYPIMEYIELQQGFNTDSNFIELLNEDCDVSD